MLREHVLSDAIKNLTDETDLLIKELWALIDLAHSPNNPPAIERIQRNKVIVQKADRLKVLQERINTIAWVLKIKTYNSILR